MVLKLHIHKPLQRFRELLSESAALRTLFNVPDSAAALPKIFYGYAEDEAFEGVTGDQAMKTLPRALIALEDFTSQRGTDSSWSTTIVLSVLLQCQTLDADKTKSLSGRYESFLQRVEGVVDNVRELAADNTRLNITNIRTDVAPQRADLKETGGKEIWWTVFVVEAGG